MNIKDVKLAAFDVIITELESCYFPEDENNTFIAFCDGVSTLVKELEQRLEQL